MTNISIKGADKVYKNLKSIMKQIGQEYSIKIGIIGEKAGQIHKGTDLNNASLGAVHEFGATILVTDKMRKYLHYKGIHLKKDTTEINIPARAFLSPLLTKEAKDYIYSSADLSGEKRDFELDKLLVESALEQDNSFMNSLADIVGAKALEMVQNEFSLGGYPDKWAPISEITKKNRIGDTANPPLDDTGELRDSFTYEIKKVK